MYREQLRPPSEPIETPSSLRPSERWHPTTYPRQRGWSVGDRAPSPADADPARSDRAVWRS